MLSSNEGRVMASDENASVTPQEPLDSVSRSDDENSGVGLAFLRLLVYTRFSLLGGAILILLGFLPWLFPTPTITAVYIQSTPLRMGTLTLVSFLASAMVIMTFRTTLYNAATRFNDPSMERFADSTSLWLRLARACSWPILGIPVPLASLIYTWSETQAADMANPLAFVMAILAGFVLALAFLYLLAYLNRKLVTANVHDPRFFPFDFSRRKIDLMDRSWRNTIEDENAKQHPLSGVSLRIGRKIAEFLARLGLREGYIAETTVWVKGEAEPQQLRFQTVGHGPLILFTTILLALQLLVLAFGPWSFRQLGWVPSDRGPFGTLFFLVGLLMVFIGVLPGISFFLDRYRIPTSWLIIGVFLGLTAVGRMFPGAIVDHAYPVTPAPFYVENQQMADTLDSDLKVVVSDDFLATPLSLEDVVKGWEIRQKKLAKSDEEQNRTFVVVTAAGGGIQASGWTTTVLSGIAESEEVNDLVSGIGLVSSVSGGSVGMLHFLTRYPELIQTLNTNDEEFRKLLLGDAIDQSTRSSLEAVGWGLLFPDTWRNLGIVRDPTYDRGWVQEQVWADRMNLSRLSNPDGEYYVEDWNRSDWRLGHLAHRVKTGELPAVVFNGFSTTTGQRIWMAPFQLREAKDERLPMDYTEFSGAMGMQLKLSTAARISATFPYVSPTSIAHDSNQAPDDTSYPYSTRLLKHCHLADGGYTDNEGLLTALELIQKLDVYYDQHEDCPFDRILLLRIAPFPSPQKFQEATVVEKSMASIEKDPSYLQSVVGPALGLYRGRTVTQLERGDLEVRTLQSIFDLREEFQQTMTDREAKWRERLHVDDSENFPTAKFDVKQNIATQQYELVVDEANSAPDEVDETPARPKLQFAPVLVDFRLERNGDNVHPPLSWKLNWQQKTDLAEAWKNWQQDKQLAAYVPKEETADVVEAKQPPITSNADPSQWSPVQSNLPTIDGGKNVLELKEKFSGKR